VLRIRGFPAARRQRKMSDPVPPRIHSFLNAHVHSIAHLELLLLVHRNAEKPWTAEEAAKALYIPPVFAESLLESLRGAGMVTPVDGAEGSFRYAPKVPELDQTVVELEAFYRERPVTTIQAIHSAPTDTLQNFSDAFRIRKREETD
jgi:hypothetical protein